MDELFISGDFYLIHSDQSWLLATKLQNIKPKQRGNTVYICIESLEFVALNYLNEIFK